MKVQTFKEKVLAGGQITRQEALTLWEEPLEPLCAAADEIRARFCGDGFDLCAIVNGKCGRCSEDCVYCAQSGHYATQTESYPLLDTETLVRRAKAEAEQGVLRFSIVTSGRSLSPREVEQACQSVRAIRAAVPIQVCVSFGLLAQADFARLKEAGVSRAHCNLETSAAFFPSICTTHRFADKLTALEAARRAGLQVCSGGIMGLGETVEDRVDMALTLRRLDVKSVPVNFLAPIPGTPCESLSPLGEEEKRRIVALYRFLLPDVSLRLAGGRGQMADKGEACFRGGANAAISGNMLTTAGITTQADLRLLQNLGYRAVLCHE